MQDTLKEAESKASLRRVEAELKLRQVGTDDHERFLEGSATTCPRKKCFGSVPRPKGFFFWKSFGSERCFFPPGCPQASENPHRVLEVLVKLILLLALTRSLLGPAMEKVLSGTKVSCRKLCKILPT